MVGLFGGWVVGSGVEIGVAVIAAFGSGVGDTAGVGGEHAAMRKRKTTETRRAKRILNRVPSYSHIDVESQRNKPLATGNG